MAFIISKFSMPGLTVGLLQLPIISMIGYTASKYSIDAYYIIITGGKKLDMYFL